MKSTRNSRLSSLARVVLYPQDFLGNQMVYATISQRAGGLSIGINMAPNQMCNFDCVYCQVKRDSSHANRKVDVKVMSRELAQLLAMVQMNRVRELNGFKNVPDDLLQLKDIALSGEGEPTLCPNFLEVVQELLRVRGNPQFPKFKLVLITNATGLSLPAVSDGLALFEERDEVWAKLDAGTQEHMDRVDRSPVPLKQVLSNIRMLASKRSVVIQSLFCSVEGVLPSEDEIEAYADRLNELVEAGAQIQLVQIYSVTREPGVPGHCEHLSLSELSRIARRVRDRTQLPVEVF